jgi:predicted dehydrogenase
MAAPAPLRVALVGYGMAGHDFHGPLLGATDGLAVTHVVTSDPARVEAVHADLPKAVTVPRSADLWPLAEELDLVVLASPTAAHAAQALDAIAAGLPVVVDKPLGVDAAEGRRVVEAAEAAGVPLTVFQNRRWDSEHLTARRLLAEGALGDVVRYEARYERWRPEPKHRWREDLPTEQGGGLLLDLQSHLVDAAMLALGPVVAVYAELAAVTTAGHDVTFLALEHESGAHSHLSATSLAGAVGPRLRILGQSGAYLVAEVPGEPSAFDTQWADADEADRGWLVRGDERTAVRREPGDWSAFYAGVVAMVRDGAPPPVDPWDAVAVLEVLDAAQRSAADRATVLTP